MSNARRPESKEASSELRHVVQAVLGLLLLTLVVAGPLVWVQSAIGGPSVTAGTLTAFGVTYPVDGSRCEKAADAVNAARFSSRINPAVPPQARAFSSDGPIHVLAWDDVHDRPLEGLRLRAAVHTIGGPLPGAVDLPPTDARGLTQLTTLPVSSSCYFVVEISDTLAPGRVDGRSVMVDVQTNLAAPPPSFRPTGRGIQLVSPAARLPASDLGIAESGYRVIEFRDPSGRVMSRAVLSDAAEHVEVPPSTGFAQLLAATVDSHGVLSTTTTSLFIGSEAARPDEQNDVFGRMDVSRGPSTHERQLDMDFLVRLHRVGLVPELLRPLLWRRP